MSRPTEFEIAPVENDYESENDVENVVVNSEYEVVNCGNKVVNGNNSLPVCQFSHINVLSLAQVGPLLCLGLGLYL